MKSALFIVSIVFLALSSAFYIGVTLTRNANKQYWGDTLSTEGLWLSKENQNIADYKITEQVTGFFSGNEDPIDSDKNLMILRLADSASSTDYKVTIPRLYNSDNIKLTPSDIIEKFTSEGTAVIKFVDEDGQKAGYVDSIFFPPAQ